MSNKAFAVFLFWVICIGFEASCGPLPEYNKLRKTKKPAIPTTFPTKSQPTHFPSSAPSFLPSLAPTMEFPEREPITIRPTRKPIRVAPTLVPTGPCSQICLFINDGECDDGGPGSTGSLCFYGTDCADCGVRVPATPKPSTPYPSI